MSEFFISPKDFSFEDIKKLMLDPHSLILSPEVKQKILACREYLDQKLQNTDDPIYGINTGFGSLYKQKISRSDLETLQENLVKSHACGAGKPIDEELVSLMLLFKIKSLSKGHSGIQLATVERLTQFYNHRIMPVVYEFGSLGASGDLAPLAHLSLPLMGQGKVKWQDQLLHGASINRKMGWEPLRFKAKEGLALLNGTQFMSAYGFWCLYHARKLYDLANLVAALSIDAFNCNMDPYQSLIHQTRPHSGQAESAGTIRKLLEGSSIARQVNKQLQDPYSFRCIPQVHGASKDTVDYLEQVMLTEINSVTDNPLIFPEQDKILSGGNFHGQPLALAFDFLSIAMTELGNISERRTFQLISGLRELPDFLIANPGLNSGLMIPQYTAASLLSQSKQLSAPASVDSIVSSNGQEDHVSMGANAAVKARQIIQNLYTILAIELITASQALHFREPLKTSPFLQGILSNFRQNVTFIDHDRIFYEDISKAIGFLKKIDLNT
ncbi:MAG: histidine ammonia-lyase [Candidatus Cyclobacteriaceae bacterium M3_2C_046]